MRGMVCNWVRGEVKLGENESGTEGRGEGLAMEGGSHHMLR